MQDGKTPLFTAAEKGQIAVARVLLQYGANSKLSSDVSATGPAVVVHVNLNCATLMKTCSFWSIFFVIFVLCSL